MMLALLLALSATASLASAAPSDAPARVVQAQTLRCGTLNLRMISLTLAGPTAPLAPLKQRLTRRAGARRIPVTLERSPSISLPGGRVADRYVASWACLTGARQAHYVLLGYACTADPGDPHDCGGAKEWFRMLDARGRLVDAGVPRNGAARDRLNARLGIAGAMAAGVKMTPIVQ